jgi:hypothetical protein
MAALSSAVACASVAATASSAPALAPIPSCAATSTSTPFAPWGDQHSYFLMPDGGFESGATGWSLGGNASVVNGSETFAVHRAADTKSLALPSGARAASPAACVAMGENTIRLFVNAPDDPTSVLHIRAYVRNPLTGLVLSTQYDVHGTNLPGGWQPTDAILIPNLLGGVLGTQDLTLVLTTSGPPGTWGIDDVYVDPFKQR